MLRAALLILLFLTAIRTTAQWNSDTLVRNQLSTVNVNGIPTILPDGQNGYFIGWHSSSLAGPVSYGMQRINANGDTLWQQYGKTIVPAVAFDYSEPGDRSLTAGANSDGYIAWSNIAAFSNARIFVQRFNATGDTLFGPNGISLSPTPSSSTIHHVLSLPDDSGGVIILYRVQYFSGQPFIGIERVDSSGNRLIPPQTRIGPAGARYLWEVATDDHGGGFCLLENSSDAFLLHFNRHGAATWASPLQLNIPCIDDSSQAMVEDPVSSGCFLASLNDNYDIINLQYFDTSGAARWPGDGIEVSNQGNWAFHPLVAPDYSGGAWVGYSLRYTNAQDSMFYIVKHYDASGNMVSGTDTTVIHMPSAAFRFTMAPDRNGGVYIAWEEFRYGRICIFGQHFDATGQRLWRADGYPVITATNQYTQSPCTGGSCNGQVHDIADAGTSGFIAAWGDNRLARISFAVYATKADGLLPTAIADHQLTRLPITVAPNPATERLQLITDGPIAATGLHYTIYDLSNKVEETGIVYMNEETIDVSRLAPGCYFLHLTSGQRQAMIRWMKL